MRRKAAPAIVVMGPVSPSARPSSPSSGASPQGEVATIPGAGHFPFMEAPDAFGGTAEDLLERAAAG